MNLRVIKKDVKFLTEEFMSDALIGLSYAKNDEKKEKLVNLINEAGDLHDEIIFKINHPEGKARNYYNTLMADFITRLDALYENMSK